jgi:ribosomal protein S18 acetylase RimI-like enzyme
MPIALRPATPDDAALLAQLSQDVHRIHVANQPDFFKPIRPDDPELIAFYENQIATVTCIIAEVDGEPVGYMMCQIVNRPENVFSYAQSRLHIDHMSVNEGYRSQGIGKALMDRAYELARQHQVDSLTLSVWAFNTDAQRFYVNNGFENAYQVMWAGLKNDI